jgi:hypothetical protein
MLLDQSCRGSRRGDRADVARSGASGTVRDRGCNDLAGAVRNEHDAMRVLTPSLGKFV